MRIETKLCHISDKKVIVKVSAWFNGKKLGSALAEGSTVEIAEDKAILRINQRLNETNSNETKIKFNNQTNADNKINIEVTKKEKQTITNENTDPTDWSIDLSAIDSEIIRLNWSRDDEISFLKKTLGYNNRNKITKYNELKDYLNTLKKIDSTNNDILKSNNLDSLIEESEILLKELSWDYKKGREYLQKEFNVSSRKELDEEELKSFVTNLKSRLNKNLSNNDFTN